MLATLLLLIKAGRGRGMAIQLCSKNNKYRIKGKEGKAQTESTKDNNDVNLLVLVSTCRKHPMTVLGRSRQVLVPVCVQREHPGGGGAVIAASHSHRHA